MTLKFNMLVDVVEVAYMFMQNFICGSDVSVAHWRSAR